MKEKPKPDSTDIGAIEPWRCTGCGLFVYNLAEIDGGIYPIGGASPPRYISTVYNKVCSVCFDMFHSLLSRDYWKIIQDSEQSKIRKLRSGSDYLTS
jgi:hypothetical protein